MFTGLVEERGTIERCEARGPGVRLFVQAEVVSSDARLGDSIAVNGCCLTVVEINSKTLAFDAGTETLGRTNLGRLQGGSFVNLERSLRVGDRLGGHYVTGHIDATGALDERSDEGEWSKFWFRVPPALTRQMVSKGSIAVDGVSLTVVDVEPTRFSVALIPHTLAVTTLGGLRPGDPVNLETDLLAKYVEKQLSGRGDDWLAPRTAGDGGSPGNTPDVR
jgi:riboflavin synthase